MSPLAGMKHTYVRLATSLSLVRVSILVINSKTCSCKNSKHFTQYCAGFCGFLEIVRCCAGLIELCGPAPAHSVRSSVRRKVDPNRGALGVFPNIPDAPSKKSISSFHSPGLTSKISLFIIANLAPFRQFASWQYIRNIRRLNLVRVSPSHY